MNFLNEYFDEEEKLIYKLVLILFLYSNLLELFSVADSIILHLFSIKF